MLFGFLFQTWLWIFEHFFTFVWVILFLLLCLQCSVKKCSVKFKIKINQYLINLEIFVSSFPCKRFGFKMNDSCLRYWLIEDIIRTADADRCLLWVRGFSLRKIADFQYSVRRFPMISSRIFSDFESKFQISQTHWNFAENCNSCLYVTLLADTV